MPDTSAAGVSHVGALSITGATVNLAANKLITTSPVGSASGGVYDGVSGLIQSGRGSGAWNGPTGILTTQTLATTSNFTSIGVAAAQQVKGLATASDTGVWADQTVTGSDTLVMTRTAGMRPSTGRSTSTITASSTSTSGSRVRRSRPARARHPCRA